MDNVAPAPNFSLTKSAAADLVSEKFGAGATLSILSDPNLSVKSPDLNMTMTALEIKMGMN